MSLVPIVIRTMVPAPSGVQAAHVRRVLEVGGCPGIRDAPVDAAFDPFVAARQADLTVELASQIGERLEADDQPAMVTCGREVGNERSCDASTESCA